MRVLFLVTISSLVLLAGCSTTGRYHIEPEYQQNKINSPVLILPIQRDWFEGNFTHTFGSLSGSQKDAFYSSLKSIFSEKVQSELYMIQPGKQYPDTLFMNTHFTTGSLEFNAMVPRKNVKIEYEGMAPRIILVLDQYFFRKRQELGGGNTYAGHESQVKNYLYFETKYVYWDTEKGIPLAWGATNAKNPLTAEENLGFQDYLSVLSEAVNKIAKQGPVL